MCFVYLLQAGERSFPPPIHTHSPATLFLASSFFPYLAPVIPVRCLHRRRGVDREFPKRRSLTFLLSLAERRRRFLQQRMFMRATIILVKTPGPCAIELISFHPSKDALTLIFGRCLLPFSPLPGRLFRVLQLVGGRGINWWMALNCVRASERESEQGHVRTASERSALRRWKAKRGSPRGSRTRTGEQVRSVIPRNSVCGMFHVEVTRNLFPL